MEKNEYLDKAIVLTTGYGNTPMEGFLVRLQAHNITVLVDVRSYPGSKYRPEFNSAAFTVTLRRVGIKYLWKGRVLGGKGATKDQWLTGLAEVAKLSETENVVLMCAEKDVMKCHRSELGELLATTHRVHSFEI